MKMTGKEAYVLMLKAYPDILNIDEMCEVLKVSTKTGYKLLKEGKDVTIVATGICVAAALDAAEILKGEGIDAEVINICTIKPIDEELLLASAGKTGKVVTAEEHSVIGGLGGAVAEVLSEKLPTKLCRIGVQDRFGESGTAGELVAKYGLDGAGIAAKTLAFVKG